MVEIGGKPEIDFADPYTTVKVLRDSLNLQSWRMIPENCDFKPDLHEPGVVKLQLVLKNLPRDFSAIQGTVIVKIAARIINIRAGKASVSLSSASVIPINIQHKTPDLVQKPAGSIITSPGDVLMIKQDKYVVQRMNGEYQHKYPERAYKTGLVNAVYALFDAKPFLSEGRAVLLGAVCFGEGQKSTTTVQEADLPNPSNLIPEATLSIKNLKTLPTKILENSKAPNNPGMVFVRGSIELTRHDTMAEYIEAAFLPETTIVTATLQRTTKGEITGIKGIKSISLQTMAGDVTLCKLDKDCVERIREEFTPTPYKSPALEQAEADCPTSGEIKKKLKNRQQVPKYLLDEAPNECEMVLNYYKITYSPNIDCVYAILKQDGQGKYFVQGILTFDTSTKPWKTQPLSFESQIRRAALDTAGLKSLPVKVFEKDFDGKNVAVRGSIMNSQASTMLEHIQWFVNHRVQEGFGNEDYKATGVRFGNAGPIRTVINLKPAGR